MTTDLSFFLTSSVCGHACVHSGRVLRRFVGFSGCLSLQQTLPVYLTERVARQGKSFLNRSPKRLRCILDITTIRAVGHFPVEQPACYVVRVSKLTRLVVERNRGRLRRDSAVRADIDDVHLRAESRPRTCISRTSSKILENPIKKI